MSRNPHERLQPDLIDLVHREISPWRTLRVWLHLAHCAPCRQEKRHLETLWRSLRSLAPAPPSRLRPKGTPMYLRLALACGAAAFAVTGTTVAYRAFQKPAGPGSRVFSTIHQFWTFQGDVRGKIVLRFPDTKVDQARPDDALYLTGQGTERRVRLTMAPTSDNDNRIGPEMARIEVGMGETFPVKDRSGTVVATATLLPLTPAEDQHFLQITEVHRQRLIDLYQSPATLSLDTPDQSSGGANLLPGLISWAEFVDYGDDGRLAQGPDGQAVHLETGGLGWKVVGDARVTMTLRTDPRHPEYVRHFASLGPIPAAAMTMQYPELRDAFNAAVKAQPTIYWYQAAPGGPKLPGSVQVGKYLLDDRGGWANVVRSGTFAGYGTHIVRGPDGAAQLILEVAPR